MVISDKTSYKDGGCSFVFVCKKRSFKILVSPYFDRAPENLFDENLAILMNLPIKNITCSPHTISGVKTWNVGYISTTVQCVQDGISLGEMHLKAKVIRDLQTIIGSHALAGCSTDKRLSGSGHQEIPGTPKSKIKETHKTATSPYQSSPKTPNKKISPKSSNPSSYFTSPTSPSLIRNITSPPTSRDLLSPGSRCVRERAIKRVVKSPPGFSYPIYPPSPPPTKNSDLPKTPIMVPANLPIQPDTKVMSPYSANISRLMDGFGDADLIDGIGQIQAYLSELDPGGQIKPGNSGLSYAFYKSRDSTFPTATHGPVYQSGHGRTWCRISCQNLDFHPHNCGHHPQWRLPAGFQRCSSECKAGLCGCLKDYRDDSGY